MEYREINKIIRNLNLYKNRVTSSSEINGTEFELVRYVSKRESRPMIEVAEYLNVDKALVTRMTKKLKDLGYIEILSDETDKRKKLLKATVKGHEIKDTMYNIEIKYFEYITSVLNNEQKELFLNYINKVYLKSKSFRKSGFKDIDE